MDNGLPDLSFDRVFSLESAHLMPDKERLFLECFRVLKPGSKLARSDVAAGFTGVEITDISAETRRTLEHWGHNAHLNRDQLIERLGETYVENFFLALLHMSFGWGRLGGYILMSGMKP